MAYKLGKRSRSRLAHVHHDLVLVAGRAIQITEVDFSVLEGKRAIERQQELINSGASSLKDPTSSRHVPNEQGIVHAIDVGAYVNGGIRWDWPLYHQIAKAFKQASKELNIPIEWGGIWDRKLAALGGDMGIEVENYIIRRKNLGKKAFIDGPHFQLPSSVYS